MQHDYNQSSKYEISMQPIADAFYKSKFNDVELIRYNSNTDTDKGFQLKDIDLKIKLGERTINVSEKFRKEIYNDLLIELYSKYPDKKGWMENSEAEYIAYFCPGRVYTFNKNDLLGWFEPKKFDYKLKEEIDLLHKNNLLKKARKKLKIDDIPLSIIQSPNNTNGKEWHTISIAIDWDFISQFIKIKSFPLVN